jgi:hypothetical protein
VNTNAFEIQTGPPININTNFGMMVVSLAVANAQNDRSIIPKPEFNLQGCDFVELTHRDIDMKDTEAWCASMLQNVGEYDDNMCTHVGANIQ